MGLIRIYFAVRSITITLSLCISILQFARRFLAFFFLKAPELMNDFVVEAQRLQQQHSQDTTDNAGALTDDTNRFVIPFHSVLLLILGHFSVKNQWNLTLVRWR